MMPRLRLPQAPDLQKAVEKAFAGERPWGLKPERELEWEPWTERALALEPQPPRWQAQKPEARRGASAQKPIVILARRDEAAPGAWGPW